MCTPPELLGRLSKLTTPDTYTVSAAAAGQDGQQLGQFEEDRTVVRAVDLRQNARILDSGPQVLRDQPVVEPPSDIAGAGIAAVRPP